MQKCNKILSGLALLALVSLISYDVSVLYLYAMDMPFWDTWDLFPKGNFRHLLSFYNENMQFFYFIISEIMYKLTDWNLRYFTFVNFAIYCGLALIYVHILKYARDGKIPYYPLFFCALFTPLLGYNWLWVVLVQTHTFILCFLCAIYYGFVKDEHRYAPYLCAVFLFLSAISMNIPLMIGGTLAYTIKELVNSKQSGVKQSFKNILIVLTILSALMTALCNMTNAEKFIDIQLKNSVFTWEYIQNLSFYLMNSIGLFSLAKILNWKICVGLMIIHFSLLAIAFFEQYRIKQRQPLWGIIFGILFCICGIISFRGGELYAYELGFIRHNETAFMLIPAVLAVLCLSQKSWIRVYGILLMCVMLYGVMADIHSRRFQLFGRLFYQNGCLCSNHYYYLKTINEWQCRMNSPIPRIEAIKKGEEMNLSFIKTIKNCQ